VSIGFEGVLLVFPECDNAISTSLTSFVASVIPCGSSLVILNLSGACTIWPSGICDCNVDPNSAICCASVFAKVGSRSFWYADLSPLATALYFAKRACALRSRSHVSSAIFSAFGSKSSIMLAQAIVALTTRSRD